MTESSYYILTPDKDVQVGDMIPNAAPSGHPNAAWIDPRCIEISEALHGRADDGLVNIVRAGEATPIHLIRVKPVGRVRVHTWYHDESDAEVDERTALESEDGWVIEALEPLTLALGPQGEQIIAAVREGFRVLDEEEDKAAVAAYDAAIEEQYDAMETATQYAEDALRQRGADGYWWARRATGCCWGNEILALAAWDLIGSTPEWTQQAYDLLTFPWRTSLALPLHPDDAVVTS